MYPHVTQFETRERMRRQHIALVQARALAARKAGAGSGVTAARRGVRGPLLVPSLRRGRPPASA